ncbi:PhzF family isomerase [Roseibium sp. SCP14]|uniref:PhzF family isomerase n=1 Tax=Roseibium sp. SCP14 TaxID=3141375 RepID=UPI003338FDB6
MTKIHIIDAFTKTAGTGNRAGVVLEADGLSASEMQAIAAFAGYSETAFVLSPSSDDHDIHVRYFTPGAEVPICGHATIATHFLRATMSGTDAYPIRAKTGAGILPVSITGEGNELLVSMRQGAVDFGPVFNEIERCQLASALNIDPSEFADDLPIQIVSTGHSKVIVPLRSRQVLDALDPDPDKLIALSKAVGCNGFFPFVLEGTKEHPETHGRMFAPAIGILEDPVTGNANGPAGAYLVHYGLVNWPQDSITYAGHQGHTMGKAGTVHVTVAADDSGLRTSVAGYAVVAGTREYRPSCQGT